MGYTATARHTNNYSRHEVFLLLDAKLWSPCLINDSGSLQGPRGTAQQVASNSFCVLHYGSYSPILLNSFYTTFNCVFYVVFHIHLWLYCSLVIIHLVWTYGTWWVPPVWYKWFIWTAFCLKMCYTNNLATPCLMRPNLRTEWSCVGFCKLSSYSLNISIWKPSNTFFFFIIFFASEHGCDALTPQKNTWRHQR